MDRRGARQQSRSADRGRPSRRSARDVWRAACGTDAVDRREHRLRTHAAIRSGPARERGERAVSRGRRHQRIRTRSVRARAQSVRCSAGRVLRDGRRAAHGPYRRDRRSRERLRRGTRAERTARARRAHARCARTDRRADATPLCGRHERCDRTAFGRDAGRGRARIARGAAARARAGRARAATACRRFRARRATTIRRSTR